MRILVAFIFVVAPIAARAAAPEPLPPSEKAVLDAVWGALNADPALANQHRGYLAYVSTRPDLAAALDALRPLERHPVLGEFMAAFEDSVSRDPELNRAYQEFYGALAGDDALRNAADAVYRLELGLDSASLQTACISLKADVDAALRFLANPAKPAPMDLYPFKTLFKQNPRVREELVEALNTLHKMPAAHAAVFPWWRKISVEKDGVCLPYVNLVAELSRQPQRFWIWHAAQVELAKHPKARPWLVEWKRRVRQDRVLATQYDAYLDIIRRRPDYGKAALDAWEADPGPAPSWPPDMAPQKPPAPAPSDRTRPNMPARPEVMPPAPQQPRMPDMPQMPQRPGKPGVERPPVPPLQSMHNN